MNLKKSFTLIQAEIADRLLERLDCIDIKPRAILVIGPSLAGLSQRYPAAEIFTADITEPLAFATHSIDLVLSNLALDPAQNIEPIFHEIHRVLKPEGILLFSMLGTADNPAYDMHTIGDLLLHQGFKDPVMDVDRLEQCEIVYGHALGAHLPQDPTEYCINANEIPIRRST